ncbi:hypothetical protein Q4485_07030 [Granulosicoccaceae sp. 1_MG-2023]|nr:hypothetical protein [Granulosicoccaceae sp. 1_MG-2023]
MRRSLVLLQILALCVCLMPGKLIARLAIVVEPEPAAVAPLSSALQEAAAGGESVSVILSGRTTRLLSDWQVPDPSLIENLTAQLTSADPGRNPASGVERAFGVLGEVTDDSGPSRLLILSDGRFNTGDAQDDQRFAQWLTLILAEDINADGTQVLWQTLSDSADSALIERFLESAGAPLATTAVSATARPAAATDADRTASAEAIPATAGPAQSDPVSVPQDKPSVVSSDTETASPDTTNPPSDISEKNTSTALLPTTDNPAAGTDESATTGLSTGVPVLPALLAAVVLVLGGGLYALRRRTKRRASAAPVAPAKPSGIAGTGAAALAPATMPEAGDSHDAETDEADQTQEIVPTGRFAVSTAAAGVAEERSIEEKFFGPQSEPLPEPLPHPQAPQTASPGSDEQQLPARDSEAARAEGGLTAPTSEPAPAPEPVATPAEEPTVLADTAALSTAAAVTDTPDAAPPATPEPAPEPVATPAEEPTVLADTTALRTAAAVTDTPDAAAPATAEPAPEPVATPAEEATVLADTAALRTAAAVTDTPDAAPPATAEPAPAEAATVLADTAALQVKTPDKPEDDATVLAVPPPRHKR